MVLIVSRSLLSPEETMSRSMPIQLVAIDIDRTLLDDNRGVSEANLAALRRAQAKGAQIALCSGRDLPSTRAISQPMGLAFWLVIQNGSLVIDPAGRAVYTCSLSEATANRALDVLNRHGLGPVVYELYPRAQHVWWQEGARSAPGMLEFRREHGAVITVIKDIRSVLTKPVSHLEVFDSAERVLAADREFAADPEVVAITNLSSSQRGAALMGIYPAGTSKERALEQIARTLGITSAEVLAIGDNLNDIGMVRWAGMGVMVANGPEEARKAADWVAPSNNESGVAAAIERFVG